MSSGASAAADVPGGTANWCAAMSRKYWRSCADAVSAAWVEACVTPTAPPASTHDTKTVTKRLDMICFLDARPGCVMGSPYALQYREEGCQPEMPGSHPGCETWNAQIS